jgi:hypothetical protein
MIILAVIVYVLTFYLLRGLIILGVWGLYVAAIVWFIGKLFS